MTDAATLRQLLAEARGCLHTLMQDRADAAGELRVNVRDCGPGTLAGKLLSANVILRHANGTLLGSVVDAERDRDIARTQLRVVAHLLREAISYLDGRPYDGDEAGACRDRALFLLSTLDTP